MTVPVSPNHILCIEPASADVLARRYCPTLTDHEVDTQAICLILTTDLLKQTIPYCVK